MSRFFENLRHKLSPYFPLREELGTEAADTRAEIFDLLLPEETACLQVVCEIRGCYNPAAAQAIKQDDCPTGLPWHLSMTFYLDVSGQERAALEHQLDSLALAHGGKIKTTVASDRRAA